MGPERTIGLTGGWDGRISRRTLLRTGGSAAAGLLVLGRAAPAPARPPWEGDPFSLGVASGEPSPDGFVLWTRLAPEPLQGGGLKEEPYGVRFEISTDAGFSTIVRRGAVEALPEEVHSVHAEIAGLEPDTDYWYRFKWGRAESPVGRTRTAPRFGASPDALRFAFVGGQNYSNGYYHAYADLAAQTDIHFVIHTGDYIYEGPGGTYALASRPHAPKAELFSLSDYRTRHAQYKTDPALQAAHGAFPWLLTWDDHEFKNNYADLDIDEPDTPLETIAARRAAAYLAYWEHLPLPRSRKPVGKDMHMYRRTQWGDLATFHLLDTRQYRSNQMTVQCPASERDPVSGYCPVPLQPGRTMLGTAQLEWLFDGLASTPAAGWNVLGNQVGFAAEDGARGSARRFNADPWDGYVAERQRILDFVKAEGIDNLVVITGDKHQNSVRNVSEHYTHWWRDPWITTEFIGTSISSEGDHRDGTDQIGGTADNPHILRDEFSRGYVRVELDRTTWRSDFRVVGSVTTPEPQPAWTLESWVVEHGQAGAHLVAP